ncbi:uncharacterized protein SOCE836_028390 [Sorangium cellulosum]|uniref:Uncharacterized protein n=1 Tax=Sorangium cellulosum TaxID=56 RepID=A0A4P2QLM5_SORCE|nr:uncharacterized protein SOCE836_028390 [Sorangium cellulosum]
MGPGWVHAHRTGAISRHALPRSPRKRRIATVRPRERVPPEKRSMTTCRPFCA